MGNCETTSRGEGGAALVRSAAGKDLSPAAFTARTSVSSSSPAPNQIQPISPSIGPNSMATTPTSPGPPYMADPSSPLPYSSTPVTSQTPQKAAEISRRIDDQLIKEHHAMEKVVKLLLLGPSESGKSTVLKQMKIIHLDGFTDAELWARRPLIFRNVVEACAQLINGLRRIGFKLPLDRDLDSQLILATVHRDDLLEHNLPDDVYYAVKRLWAEPIIQEVYERRSEFHLIDCARYFIEDIDRIYAPDYCPTITDVLYARVATIGVTELRYTYKTMEFRIIDVGGQKTERRKWIHVFDNVNAIFFIAAISEYDQMMYEDNQMNRLIDAISLFKEIGNNPLFTRVQIILFLNKKDLFAEKIARVPLTACFANYRYKNDFKNAALYITKKFEQQIKDKQKLIYPHLTCATDTGQMEFLMNSITDMIIAENFKQTGVA